MRTQRNLLLFILAFSVLLASPAARADETSIFTNIAPDAMFVIDFSGSMGWNPPGNTSIGYLRARRSPVPVPTEQAAWTAGASPSPSGPCSASSTTTPTKRLTASTRQASISASATWHSEAPRTRHSTPWPEIRWSSGPSARTTTRCTATPTRAAARALTPARPGTSVMAQPWPWSRPAGAHRSTMP